MQNIKPYIKIARPDHWVKQIFVIPGIILAAILTNAKFIDIIIPAIMGLVATCLIASANYVINEWLDAEFDKFHPKKKDRPSVNSKVKAEFVYVEYLLLGLVGVVISAAISFPFLLSALALLLMGILYNVEPFRTKDKPYLDVLSESINNPIRLMLGWFTVVSSIFPPSTLLLSYWMGGAFLMGIKRYAEYNFINNKEIAGLYRKSFIYYTKETLLVSSFFYALSCAFFLGVFMIKYKVELILSFPFFSGLFAWYLYLAFRPDSPAHHPEGLYTEKKFVIYVLFLAILVLGLTVSDIPALKVLTESIFNS